MILELVFNISGEPTIKIEHNDRSKHINDQLIGYFVKEAKERGIYIARTGGMLEVGTNNSQEFYEIKLNPKKEPIIPPTKM